MMLNSINEETRLSLLCENFAYLSSEERAGILFTTADDVNVYQPKIFLFYFIYLQIQIINKSLVFFVHNTVGDAEAN